MKTSELFFKINFMVILFKVDFFEKMSNIEKGERMRDFVAFFKESYLQSIFLVAIYIAILIKMYMDLKDSMSIYNIFITWIFGILLGIILIVKVVNPFLKTIDAKIESFRRKLLNRS